MGAQGHRLDAGAHRPEPRRPLGLLQPIADGLKLLVKEIIIPAGANKFLFVLAPIMAIMPALAAWAVVPFSPELVLANIDAGLLYVMAITSMGVYGVIIAGWASNSKYAFLGAMRSAAQIVSYEIAMGFALVGVLMAAQSLNLVEIVNGQQGNYGVLNWFFIPLFPFFLVYLIAGVAETNRAPFDVAEGESEIVAGFHVEYSGMAFAVFFLAEYANMILVSTLALDHVPRRLAVADARGVRQRDRAAVACRGQFRLAARRRSPSCCSVSCGSARRSRATATTRSCGWAGKCSSR